MGSEWRRPHEKALDEKFWGHIKSGGEINDEERQELAAILDANSHYDDVAIGSDAKPHRLWDGSKDARTGLGIFRFRGHNMFAHRAAVLVESGSIPAGLICRRDDACPANCIEVSHISTIDRTELNKRNLSLVHVVKNEAGKSLHASRTMTMRHQAAKDERGKSLFALHANLVKYSSRMKTARARKRSAPK